MASTEKLTDTRCCSCCSNNKTLDQFQGKAYRNGVTLRKTCQDCRTRVQAALARGKVRTTPKNNDTTTEPSVEVEASRQQHDGGRGEHQPAKRSNLSSTHEILKDTAVSEDRSRLECPADQNDVEAAAERLLSFFQDSDDEI